MIETDVIYFGDCLDVMSNVDSNTVDLGIADPPYNIGFDYGEDGHKDNIDPHVYAEWCRNWLIELYRILRPGGAFWLIIGDEWAAELITMAKRHRFNMRSWVIWYYTFGVNCTSKFTRSHAHLVYFTKNKTGITFNADQIRVPSSRQLIYADKRANPDGRLPDDTWILRPEQVPDGFASLSSVWNISRVCGTFKERIEGAANQLPEQLVARIIRSCSNEGDLVFDPMVGTGTVPTVAKKLNRRYLGAELTQRFADMAATRVSNAKVGDPIGGVQE